MVVFHSGGWLFSVSFSIFWILYFVRVLSIKKLLLKNKRRLGRKGRWVDGREEGSHLRSAFLCKLPLLVTPLCNTEQGYCFCRPRNQSSEVWNDLPKFMERAWEPGTVSCSHCRTIGLISVDQYFFVPLILNWHLIVQGPMAIPCPASKEARVKFHLTSSTWLAGWLAGLQVPTGQSSGSHLRHNEED